ncbi:MAG TPA: rhomboid family intramembrane serine protease [Kofleriaceae bacterium]|nr:rhomboid family intramembrane serine protease [Kofleriaceae bacterium]
MSDPPAKPPRTNVIYAIIALNLIAFAIELAAGADAFSPNALDVLKVGANYAPMTLHGEPWRIVTAMFLHFGAIHIGMNMLCLWQGRIVEQIFGPLPFAAIYVVSGLVGGVATLLRGDPVVSAGASGAVFGVYGAFAAVLVLRRARIPADVWQKTARSMGTFLAINLMIGLGVPGIDLRAHVGGLVGGFACGAVLLAGAKASWRRPLALFAGGIAIAGAAIALAPKPSDYLGALDELARVEKAANARIDDIKARLAAGKISGAQAADELERDVIAPWSAASRRMEGIEPPAASREVYDAMRSYASARDVDLATWVALLRAPASEHEARTKELQRTNAAVHAAGDAVREASARKRR